MLHGTMSIDIYGRLSPPKIQGSQIDQQIQSWSKDPGPQIIFFVKFWNL